MTLKIIKRLENMFKTEKCKSGYVTYLVECSGCGRQYPCIKRNISKYEHCYVCGNREKAKKQKLGLYNNSDKPKRKYHKRDPFSHKFQSIVARCRYPYVHGYKNYGGRGIKCERETLADFKRDMYESYLEHVKKYGVLDTTIDRIDINGNYNKENCRWMTMKEQQSTKRTNLKVEYKGKVYPTLESLCKEKGLRYGTVHMRIYHYGWDIEKAIDTPIVSKR